MTALLIDLFHCQIVRLYSNQLLGIVSLLWIRDCLINHCNFGMKNFVCPVTHPPSSDMNMNVAGEKDMQS